MNIYLVCSASYISETHSQTTEYDGEMDLMEKGDEIINHVGIGAYDPRLPSPAKVRWLKAFHKIRNQLREVSEKYSVFRYY